MEQFKYKDLLGNEVVSSLSDVADRKVLIDLYRKLTKGDYTLLLTLGNGVQNYDAVKSLSEILAKELDFRVLIIQYDTNRIELIAYFQLMPWQTEQTTAIIKSYLELIEIK